MIQPLFESYVMAMERVERRLHKVTAALDAESIPYAVIGGNAVAAWVARIDPSATRTTKDVDLLVRRGDLDRISQTMAAIGFARHDLRRIVLFVDPEEASRKAGVHLEWSEEKVRPSYVAPAPSVQERVSDPGGFHVLALGALVRMKLTSFRDIDRVHIADLLGVGLIDEAIESSLEPELIERLESVRASRDDEET